MADLLVIGSGIGNSLFAEMHWSGCVHICSSPLHLTPGCALVHRSLFPCKRQLIPLNRTLFGWWLSRKDVLALSDGMTSTWLFAVYLIWQAKLLPIMLPLSVLKLLLAMNNSVNQKQLAGYNWWRETGNPLLSLTCQAYKGTEGVLLNAF